MVQIQDLPCAQASIRQAQHMYSCMPTKKELCKPVSAELVLNAELSGQRLNQNSELVEGWVYSEQSHWCVGHAPRDVLQV